MSTAKEAGNNKNIKIEAGLTGASAGTLLVVFANNLPDDNLLKPWLVLFAPSISIAISSFWIWLKAQTEKINKNLVTNRQLLKAEQTVKKLNEDPNISNENKEKSRKMLEQLQMKALRSQLKRVELLIEK